MLDSEGAHDDIQVGEVAGVTFRGARQSEKM